MTLPDLLARYLRAVETSVRYRQGLSRTVRKAVGYGIHTVCQLVPDTVNDFLRDLPLASVTRHNIRRELLTLWRFAFDREYTNVYPARVRKIKVEYTPVQAWTIKELDALHRKAASDRTFISNRVSLRRCDILPVWIAVAYESGVRFADVHGLTRQHFRNGCFVGVASKTKKPLVRALTKPTMEGVRKLLEASPDGTLFKWCLCRRRAFTLWRKFLDEHQFVGSSKWLRRTGATQLERKKRGSAKEFLQHSADHLAIRHYIDQSQLQPASVPPPFRIRR